MQELNATLAKGVRNLIVLQKMHGRDLVLFGDVFVVGVLAAFSLTSIHEVVVPFMLGRIIQERYSYPNDCLSHLISSHSFFFVV